MGQKTFKGVIKLDVRDSKQDWEPYLPVKAPEGAPNILFVLYDDTGLAAWSPFGGGINMPTLQKLADRGLMYSQWHTTALCSPTRSTLLTGRNHHMCGIRGDHRSRQRISPASTDGLPTRARRSDKSCRRAAGARSGSARTTTSPSRTWRRAASRKQWPLQKGFDRYYGFLGGETNQWYPDLTEDNRFVDQQYGPDEGYHLSKDLVDKAIGMIRDQKASNPSRPWYMWLCPGANHAPHHCPQDYIDKYKGQFDAGYEAYREWVLPRMIAKGIVPKGTELTQLNPMPSDMANPADAVRPWNTLNADEKKLFSRLMEVYAGFSEYTDAQVGRMIDYLEQSGQLENTVVLYAADNGASGEGGPNGSVNENKFFNGYPDELSENMKLLNVLGGPDTYEHYPTGWAVATSTPFKMFKRYSEYAGGTCDPLVISWPKGIKARGQVRNQYHHSTDIVPTILDICGLEMPKVLQRRRAGAAGRRLDALHLRRRPMRRRRRSASTTRCSAVAGSGRTGGRPSRVHAPLSGKGHFDKDRWELYHVDADRSESKDLAKEQPQKLKALIKAWFEEADKNLVLPLDDRSALEVLGQERPTEEAPRERVHLLSRARLPCRKASQSTCAAGRTRSSPTSRSPMRMLGRDLRPRVALRRPRAVHQGQEAALRLQLPRHQARAEVRLAGAEARQVLAGHGVHPREGGPVPRVDRGRRSSTSTTRSWPRGR